LAGSLIGGERSMVGMIIGKGGFESIEKKEGVMDDDSGK